MRGEIVIRRILIVDIREAVQGDKCCAFLEFRFAYPANRTR